MMSKNKDNPVALVTGAATGIGRATAIALQERGISCVRHQPSRCRKGADGVRLC